MRCLITNEPWEGPGPYSPAGLRLLDRRLRSLAPLPYTKDQLLEEAAARAVKMSIQGMQAKVSTVLRVTAGERLGFNPALIEQTRARFAAACTEWPPRIEASFLSAEMKTRYLALLTERRSRLEV